MKRNLDVTQFTLCVLSMWFIEGAYGDDIPNIQRYAQQSGLHREVWTDLDLPLPFHSEAVSIIVMETIPSGMYLDLHQLIMEQPWGAPQVLSSHEFDVEKPQQRSASHNVLVMHQLPWNAESSSYKGSVQLPIHLRYHQPMSSQHQALVVLNAPRILIKAQDIADTSVVFLGPSEPEPCDVTNKTKCMWYEVILSEAVAPLTFHVSVGHEEHLPVVVMGTAVTSLAASLFLIWSMRR